MRIGATREIAAVRHMAFQIDLTYKLGDQQLCHLLSILDKCTNLEVLELRFDSLPYKKAEPWNFIQKTSSYKALLKLKYVKRIKFWMRPLRYYIDTAGHELEYLRVGRGEDSALTKQDETKIREEFKKLENDIADHFGKRREEGSA